MSGRHARPLRAGGRSTVATVALAASCTLVAPLAATGPTIAATMLANYVIGVGGNGDPLSANIANKLEGQYTGEHGVEYLSEIWPVSGLTAHTFAQSVSDGNTNLNTAIAGAPSDQHIVVVGYSLGAVIANKSRKQLETDPGAPSNIEFVFIADANKPNGGIFARLPWLYVPFADIRSSGAMGPDQFTTTDITREYDTYGDFPTYLNLLSLANTLAAVQYVHPDPSYDNIDMSQYATGGETDGNTTTYADGSTKTVIPATGSTAETTYYVIHTEHLPLLMPLRQAADALGLPQGGIDAIEPVLRVFVDMGYDRTSNPATPTPLKLFTPPKKFIEAAEALPGAIQQGINNFQNPPPPVHGGVATEPTHVQEPQTLTATATETKLPKRLITLDLPKRPKPLLPPTPRDLKPPKTIETVDPSLAKDTTVEAPKAKKLPKLRHWHPEKRVVKAHPKRDKPDRKVHDGPRHRKAA